MPSPDSNRHRTTTPEMTPQEVNRVLDVGRLLLATLTSEEVGMLPALLARVSDGDVLSSSDEIDNAHES